MGPPGQPPHWEVKPQLTKDVVYPTLPQGFPKGHKRSWEEAAEPISRASNPLISSTPKAKRPKETLFMPEVVSVAKRRLEEPSPGMPGVPPAKRKCEALVTKDPITKVAVNEVSKQFADIPRPDTRRPPEKRVSGPTHASSDIKLVPKPPQCPKPKGGDNKESGKGLSETIIPKEVVDKVISEVSLARDRQGNKAHSYLEVGHQFYAG